MSITQELKEPFNPKVVHWRVGSTNAKRLGCKPWEATSGIALAYVDARDVMKRLDDVCGDYWQVEYPFDGCCRIGLKIDDEWVWRSNGAGETQVEGEKGKFSDAFKRAAVLWGVGRYLYYLPNTWCDLKGGKIVKQPSLPDWALPGKNSDRMLTHNIAVRDNLESITAVKQALAEGNFDYAAECMRELDDDTRMALGVATTKGGIWSQDETKLFGTPEYKEAVNRYFEGK